MTYIGAVDIKPGNVVGPTSLTSAPGGTGLWTTIFTDGQAATNCLNGSGGFLCSYDTGTNSAAPVAGVGAINYHWGWDFSLSGGYAFGHFEVNFTVQDDSGRCSGPGQITGPDCLTDGHNLSISGGSGPGGGPGGGAGTATGVPEPSTFVLLGAGLLIMSRRIRSKKE